ncbi:MAG: hypothetical protein V3W31_10090 [Thermodesulfobacteriota bacterium]
MANVDTVKAITDNLEVVLRGEGIKFSRKVYEDEKSIPASLIPFGRIFYRGESFEHTNGQKPGYVEIEYLASVVLREKDAADLIRRQQEWVHRIREALTVDALNTGELAASKYVSRVDTTGVDMERRDTLAFVNCKITVRYREL